MFSWVRAPDYFTLQKVFICHHSEHLNNMFQIYCMKFLHDVLILFLLFYWILKFRKCMFDTTRMGVYQILLNVNESIYLILKITGIVNNFFLELILRMHVNFCINIYCFINIIIIICKFWFDISMGLAVNLIAFYSFVYFQNLLFRISIQYYYVILLFPWLFSILAL